MKKINSLLLALIMFLSIFSINVFFAKNNSITKSHAISNFEEEYYTSNSIDLISKNSNSIINANLDKTPFDEKTNQRMDGFSVTPNADDYGQIKQVSFAICGQSGYSPQIEDNILMWVYLIDCVSFKLEISLKNANSKSLTWKFDSQSVYEMGSGWKLLALKLRDFENEQSLLSESYNLISFSYLSEVSEIEGQEGYTPYNVKTDERFSFYHIFTSKNSTSIEKTGVIKSLNKSFYEFSDEINALKSIFKGDSFFIKSPSKIFKHLYIGKMDLTEFLNSSKYYWVLSVKNPSSVTTRLDFGDSVNFFEEGFYYLSFQIYEKKTLTEELIMNASLNIFSESVNLGTFVMGSTHEIKDDEKILIKLKLSDNLESIDKLNISLSNNIAEIESYYEKEGVLYIFVYGKDDGVSELQISADVKTKNNDKIQNVSTVATINVDYTKDDVDIFMVIVWITFICFCLGIIIYLSISVVKARRNDVK